ncbi:hypothetical protein [Blastopirellula marina]|nr:hypothetical protein [Blastopirellula marina]
MKVEQFLEHHGIHSNPFAVEDAQTDTVFKSRCIDSTYHPAWQKVYGDPRDPSTSIVFGEKGAGKTAMRLQIVEHVAKHNADHADSRVYIIEYDDFNPYLDRFRDRMFGRNRYPEKALKQWKLWDHMDSILSIGVTQLIDQVLQTRNAKPSACKIEPAEASKLDRSQARDLLLLAACYDQSTAETFKERWQHLRSKLRFWNPKAWWQFAVGAGMTVLTLALMFVMLSQGAAVSQPPWWIFLLMFVAGWSPWLWKAFRATWKAWGIVKHVRTGNREVFSLSRLLMNFTLPELSSQPLPTHERTDDRYEMLDKFFGVLRSLGCTGIVVIVDRVDEPHLINGSPELMRLLLWPMLDNKFLKQPGIGFKLLLPIELTQFVDRETKEFYQRARLDKQNMIPSLQWSSEALQDVANARLAAVADKTPAPTLRDLIDDSVSDQRLLEALRSLRVPRHLFKFLYRLMVAHANAYTDQAPVWRVSSQTFDSTLAVYQREQDAFDRGLGAG